jgi:hypothetical protein
MSTLSHHVSNFVRACEALHWRLIEGDSLSIEDRDVIEQAAVELLIRMETETSTEANPCRSRQPLDVTTRRWKDTLDEKRT